MRLKQLIYSKNANSLAFFNIMGPIILNGVNFFTVPIFTRTLGPANFGVVAIYTSWVQFFTVLVGLQTSGTVSTSMVYYDEKHAKQYRSSVLLLSFISLIIISLGIALFLQPVKSFMQANTAMVVLMILQSFGAFCINFASICFTYEKQAFRNFVISIFTTFLTVGLSLLLIFTVFKGENNYMGRIIGMALPNLAIGAILFLYFMKQGKTGYNADYWKFCIPLAIPLVFHGLSQIILAQTSKVVLQKNLDETTVGIYSLVVTVANLLVIIYNALNNTWVPFMYDYLKSKDFEMLKKRTKNYLFLFMILVMGFILVSPEMINIFAGKEYESGIAIMPILAVSSFMTFLYSFPVNYQFFHRKTINIAIGTILASVVNIVLNLILIPSYGMVGAGWATLISYIALFVFHELIAKYFIRGEYPYGIQTYWWSFAGIALAWVVFLIFAHSMLIRWILGTLLGVSLIGYIAKNRSIF